MRENLPVAITLDGSTVHSVTSHIPATAHVLVLTTTIADPRVPVDLHSAYLGVRGGATHVTHLALLSDVPGGELATATHALGAMPVAEDERHGCLYDHLAHLLATLHRRGYRVAIRLEDHAIELIDR